jgi:uncharacterized protein YjbJ (UPF0337 family)
MRRTIALALLMAAFGVTPPLAVIHAQSTASTIQREADTAWAKYKGAWTQTKGAAREKWGKLTDDDLQEIDGRREVLIGKLQTRYAVSYEDAERQVGDFEARRP